MIPFAGVWPRSIWTLEPRGAMALSLPAHQQAYEGGFMTTTKLIELLKPHGDCEITMRVFDPDEQDYRDAWIHGIRVVISKDGSTTHVDLIEDE